ncbi:MAG: hypothetical protein U1E23_02575 [Reyranellaceae bacterium]
MRAVRYLWTVAAAAATLAALAPFVPAEAQWVFLARKALGRIQQMREGGQQGKPGYDFATVILDAPADRVFATAYQVARKNPKVLVLVHDPAQRRLQVAEGDRTATLTVVPFSDDVSQMMIAGHAGPGEGPVSSLVVEAVMRVCREMNKHCEVEQ